MYLRKSLTSKIQVTDITKIQLEDPNKKNIVTYIYSLLTKHNIKVTATDMRYIAGSKFCSQDMFTRKILA